MLDYKNKKERQFTSQKSVPVFSKQKLMHLTCDTLGKIIKSGKPEFRTELRKNDSIKDKCSNKLGNLQTIKHISSDRKNTPNASSSNSSSHEFNYHCSAGLNCNYSRRVAKYGGRRSKSSVPKVNLE